jgi:hypothetical protein
MRQRADQAVQRLACAANPHADVKPIMLRLDPGRRLHASYRAHGRRGERALQVASHGLVAARVGELAAQDAMHDRRLDAIHRLAPDARIGKARQHRRDAGLPTVDHRLAISSSIGRRVRARQVIPQGRLIDP